MDELQFTVSRTNPGPDNYIFFPDDTNSLRFMLTLQLPPPPLPGQAAWHYSGLLVRGVAGLLQKSYKLL